MEENAKIEETQRDTEQQVEVKTYTEEEVLQKARKIAEGLTNDAVRERLRKEREKAELETAKKVEEAVKKATMTKEELDNHQIKELTEKVATLENELNQKERLELVKNKFVEKGVPYSESLLKSLSKDLDSVDDVLGDFKREFDTKIQTAVEEKLKSSTVVMKREDTTPQTAPKINHRSTVAKIGIAK